MISRRAFCTACSSAVIARLALGRVRVFAGPPDSDILVIVSLRGGWDGLNVVAPRGGADRRLYEIARPSLRVPADRLLPLNEQFGLHPAGRPLHELYQSGKLAIVHASGVPVNTRSHFDAMEFLELGTPGEKTAQTGWLTRFLQVSSRGGGAMPAVAFGSPPTALLGEHQTVSLSSLEEFTLYEVNGHTDLMTSALRAMYVGDDLLTAAGRRTLDAIDLFASSGISNAPSTSVTYPTDDLGAGLRTIAQLLRAGIGVQAATIDVGGWDTHEAQGADGGGAFAELFDRLSRALFAFYTDIDRDRSLARRVIIVAVSEFGRRVAENASGGTDHGHAAPILALGSDVRGGRLYGQWPGLDPDQLFEHEDVAVTTDYRHVLAELIGRTLPASAIAQVFPGLTSAPLLGLT